MGAGVGRFDTIVVGVGGMGSATCYELARRGQRVLGLEQFDIPHTMGSSHGYTRIIRLAYYEDPAYVALLLRAYELWAEIERESGEPLLHLHGSIDAGPAQSQVFRGAVASAELFDLEHEILTAAALNRRFPGYHLPDDLMALFQPQGGFLLPERCIVGFVHAAIARGAQIHGRERVLEFTPTPTGGVRLRSDRGAYEADALVVTAGAWSRQLLPALQTLAVPERQVLAWLQPTRPEYFTPERFPVFNLEVPEGRYYGFPVFGVPGFKFGRYHHLEEQGEPAELSREPTARDEQLLRDFAVRYYPEGAGATMMLKSCLFTNSPDEHFIIDRLPAYPQVTIAAGFSGHGYKFASVIGEILAELALEGTSRHDISLFRLARFDRGTTPQP